MDMSQGVKKIILKYVKKYYSLKEYEAYCNDLRINASDKASKIQYAKMLRGFLDYELKRVNYKIEKEN